MKTFCILICMCVFSQGLSLPSQIDSSNLSSKEVDPELYVEELVPRTFEELYNNDDLEEEQYNNNDLEEEQYNNNDLEEEQYNNDDLEEEQYNNDDSEEVSPVVLVRTRRQSPRHFALGLSQSHQNRNGGNRKVGSLHGRFDANGFGQNFKNYHANLGAGVGSVIWRSNNKRHSLGAGAYVGQSRGRYQGFNYKSKPNFGGGLGYKFRF